MHVLDHVFVVGAHDSRGAAQLEAAGLRIGRRRAHEGQGTSNACVFFADAMLELLWIDDAAAARSPLARPLCLHERADHRDSDAAPFGVCTRAAPDTTADADEPPFATWDYTPPYLPPGTAIRIARDLDRAGRDPMLFALPRGGSFARAGELHAASELAVARCRITVRELPAASPWRTVAIPRVQVLGGGEPLLELDVGPAPKRVLDLRPDLPLRLRW
jgi:hypothetical protein